VVVGGGNVAVDAARTAVRLGAMSVTVLYRRGMDYMPAIPGEVAGAEREEVIFSCLTAPSRVVLDDDGTCVGLECLKAELGEPDLSGRRRPVPLDHSEHIVGADLVISAVGQTPDLGLLGAESLALNEDGTIT